MIASAAHSAQSAELFSMFESKSHRFNRKGRQRCGEDGGKDLIHNLFNTPLRFLRAWRLIKNKTAEDAESNL